MPVFKESSRVFICSCIIALCMQMMEVDAAGTLELRMNNFQNPTEHLRDGSCCDLFCAGQCDNIFHFALDRDSGLANDPETYYYWVKVTGVFQDENNNYFNDNMRGVNNPIIWPFDSWPGAVLFKVYIEDDDTGFSSNDPLDGMIQRLALTPARSKSTATARSITIYGIRDRDKTSLSMDYKLYCDDNYYGSACSVYCLAQDSAIGHYTCDPDTGAKICRTGWEDVSNNCLTVSDDCINNVCLNGARCVDGNRSYTCACVAGYTGRYCETNVNECESSPCLNGGTCSDLVNGYTCACLSQYVGPRCGQNACQQGPNPCQNGGTCYGSLSCLCPPRYIGNRCELTTCQAVPCVNGGICSNGTCICPTEFTGNQCEFRKCDFVSAHCQHNGSCFNGTCICPHPYTGVSCERETCIDSTCLNGGSCDVITDEPGFRCTCPASYTGSKCQTPVAQPICNPGPGPDSQRVQGSINDVTVFQGDIGALLIALIVICIVLFIIVIAFVCFLCFMCYRRRRQEAASKRRLMSTTSVTSSIEESIVTESGNGNVYVDSLGCSPSGESDEKPWKKLGKNYTEHDNQVFEVSNDYERIDCGNIRGDGKKVDDTDDKMPDLPERLGCTITDSRGDSIHLAKKLADC